MWRLLAETQSLQGDFASAAATYGTATAKAGGTSIELLSAWTNALLAAGKPQKVGSCSSKLQGAGCMSKMRAAIVILRDAARYHVMLGCT